MRFFALAIASLMACPAGAEDLESRVRELERRLEIREKPPGDAIQAWFDRGLRFESLSGDFALRLSGHAIFHAVTFARRNERDSVDTYAVREAGIGFDATLFRDWRVVVEPVHQTSRTQGMRNGVRLRHAWVEMARWPEFRIRAGLMKEPIALETLEETIWWDYLENSIVYMHAPVPDVGAMVHGSVSKGLISYALGVFNGNGAEGGGTDENSDKDVAARVMLTPSAVIESDVLHHLHVAASTTHGRQRRRAPSTPFPFQDPATATVFHANPAATNFRTDDLARWNVEMAAQVGPVEVKSEYSWFRADVEFDGDDREDFASNAWYVHAAVWLGGRRPPLGVPAVEKPLFAGGAGAFQLAGRYAVLSLDDDFKQRSGFVGARRAQEWSAVVNWFPNANVRVSLEYVLVDYGHGRGLLPSGRFTRKEDVFLLRLQASF